MNFRLAVKSFIVKDNNILLIKRRPTDAHKPAEWDIPGGRLELGEDSYEGLKRETKEETGLDIEIVMPLDVHHFTRDDWQRITMIIFLCKALSNDVRLSEEHTEFKWQRIEKDKLPEWLGDSIKSYLRINLLK